MSVDIKKIARAARIFLTEEESVKYKKNLENILPWFAQMLSLKELSNIPRTPIYSTVSKEENRNYFQDDVMKEENISEVLSNTPSKIGSLILVPKIIS
jgi:aspartyl/glutamyl-tRNA(Asn/Gln) amidotransferase C subunit